MAEGGRPVPEPCPPGEAVSWDAESSAEPLLAVPWSSVDALTSTGRAQASERPHPVCLSEDLKEAPSEGSSTNPIQFGPRGVVEHRPEGAAAARTSVCPHGTAEPYASWHPREEAVRATNHCPRAGGGMADRLLPASLPVQRCHSDNPQPPRVDCGHACHGGDLGAPEALGQSAQRQRRATVATVCRGGDGEHGGPMAQTQGGCVHVCAPGPANTCAEVETRHDPRYEEVCCGSYVHHGNLEDTYAAYCHPQSMPAPAQLLDCRDPRQLPPHPQVSLLALPRLISSVSETGLDAKRMLRCCNLGCSWGGTLPPGGGPAPGHQEYCGGTRTTTRDMGTMTAHRELRNIGVQTGQTGVETAPRTHPPPPHVFPQICLAEEEENGDESGAVEDGQDGPDGAPKAPVKEVKWDAEGMTWEVYGASVDPEELGLAIQKHLELQIKETASRAAKVTRQDTNTSRHSAHSACRRKRGGVMGSIRTPACCARSTTAVD